MKWLDATRSLEEANLRGLLNPSREKAEMSLEAFEENLDALCSDKIQVFFCFPSFLTVRAHIYSLYVT